MPRLTLRQGAWLLTTLLLLAACAQRLLTLWPQPVSDSIGAAIVPPPAVTMAAPRSDSPTLAALTLFTPAVRQENGPQAFRVGSLNPDSPQLRHAPLSTLPARLTGLLSGPRGIAIVEQAGRQQSYSPGDRLATSAELVRIFHDRIIISRNGQYEALLLK